MRTRSGRRVVLPDRLNGKGGDVEVAIIVLGSGAPASFEAFVLSRIKTVVVWVHRLSH